MQAEFEVVAKVDNILGEGPRWHQREQRLYWVDILANRVYRTGQDLNTMEFFDLGLPVGVLGFRAQGGLVVGTRDGFGLYDLTTRRLDLFADPEADRPQARFNDGATDPQGRFWAGTMTDDGEDNNLYCVGADHQVTRMETGLTITNGMGWSPDNRTFYLTDTRRRRIYAYDFDPVTGGIANRRIFTEVPDQPGEGFPDGLTIDAEGGIWSARWEGWKIVRYDPSGRVEREISIPVQCPTACCFGGPNLTDLFITSATFPIPDNQRGQQHLAGQILRLPTTIRGQAEPEYQG